MSKELISVVVPCYNEQEVLPLFYDEIIRVSDEMSEKYGCLEFEFLFVNDGSKDKTLEILRELALKDERVRYVSFSRNFGKEAGIFAGIENAKGDYVVTIDADLQHPPKLIPEMYEYVKSGEFDCASTRRISREGDSKVLSFFARSFYKLINLISQTYIIDGAQDFRFMTRQMVDAILKMPEYHRFSKGIFSWVGFKTKYIEVTNTERAAGKTTFNFWRLFKYSLEGIMAFSVAPLALSVIFGVLFCIAALVTLILSAVNGSQTALIAGIVMLVGGIQLFCTGINGQYLSKAYMETKARPKYVASETEELYKKRLK
ncbi:MAG: glycosyltransferase family 2 protein [Oscillospiraceae bacterium]|nr:glycosyltransferase family 2 protein [Oscillospiraceae bacterium]